MIVAFAVGALLAGLLLAAVAVRSRSCRRVVVVVALVIAGLTAWAPVRVAAATGSTLFVQSFANNTVNSTYPVSVPASPSGTNSACLTASGNSSSGVLLSCPSNNDAQGSGNLRLTAASTGEEGGVFAATSVPTSQGIDATFNTYQYGGSAADGIAFVLAAVNPADPLSPATIGQSGGSLGYSANSTSSGLSDAYMGIGLDVYGNFSNSTYQGSGCTNPAYITNKQVPGQVVVRGPGNATVGYCAINSTATSKSSPALTLRATTRAASVVPVEVAINPTSTSFTTASGIAVAAGTYKVVFTPVGGSATTLSGTLPTVSSGLYPSSSWTTSSGIPKQLAFGWVGSTGAVTDFHEVGAVNVVSFNPVPQLAVTQTSYSAASPALGAPVTYTVNPSISSSGTSESSPVSVSMTLPTGVTPVGAYGSGWTCSAPSGQVITCTNSSTPFAAGVSLPALTVEGIVTASGVTSSTIQSGTVATASSADGNPGYASTATAGTLPTAPSGITVSPTSGTIAGGNAVTVSGTNISGATAIEIGTTSQQQAGTPVVLLPCPTGTTTGCFTVNANGTLSIASMPAVAASTTVNVTVVTLGTASSASYAYTSAPGTPTAPTATAGVTSATVTWTAPASNNSAITGYIVTPYLNGVAQTSQSFGASTTTQTLTGLTAGASYTFTVAAVNAIGTGAASPQSTAVIPYTLPGAPTIGSVSAGDAAATVTWTAPASNGGSVITGYVVTPYIAGVAQTAQTFSSTATTETVTGLTAGTSYTFKVAAINAAGTGPASASSAAVTVNTGPSLTFTAPPAGEVSVAYSDQLTATAGTGALTWSVSSGSLPPGLTLNSSTGLLSGTPTTAGGYAFTVKVTDTTGGSATQAATVTIVAAPSLANPAPPSGQAAVAYSDTLSVTGGTGPYTWAVSSGSLPSGLTLTPSTGVLSGTPTAAGLYTFTVKVTDANGLTATQGLSINITVGPLVINATANNSTVAQGGILGYTVTINNTAATAYSGVSYSIPLSDVLDDAVYNNNAAATAGTVTVAGQTLTWTGNLAAGATVTVTFSVTVNNPDTGNGTLNFSVASPTTGTNCPASSTDARCSVSVPVSALTITQTPSVTAVAPGAVVSYTVTVTNSGQVAYTGATFTDPLTGVLDDAVYNANAAATAGTVSYSSPNLTWTGNLAVGATATITFSVTVNNPDTGNKTLTSTITSATAGTNCYAGSTDARCAATVGVQGLTISSTASAASATPGSTVQYTITVTNSGQASYTGASISDSLAGVLDDAVYNADATATVGSLSYASPNLTWTGNLAAGATATITFSATVNNPDTGDKVLATKITSPTPASNCPTGGTNSGCSTSVTILVPALTIAMSSGVSSTTPGSTVNYTVTVTDSGQTPYTGTSAVVSLAGVLDDAAYNGGAAATAGSVSYSSPNLTWTGTLAVGATATITYSVTVANPDTGSRSLVSTVTSAAAGNNCPSGSSDPRCSTTVAVLVPGLTLNVSANNTSTTAGSTVQYTVTANNTGQTTDTGVSFTDALTGVLDDAAYNNDAAATAGSVSYSSPNLTWTGTLAPGATATITFSVTVDNPDTGNKILASTVTSSAVGSNCPSGGNNPSCSSTVTVSSLAITNTANVATTTPGSVVRYTAVFTNTGQTPYTGITIATNITDVLDDATPNGDQTATSGTLTLTSTGISWTGSIPVGGVVTVTGTVTVNNPDTGNKVMTSTLGTAAPGSNCPSGTTDPACTATVDVLLPGLTIVKTANTSVAEPGTVIGYTITVTDSGQTSYTGAVVKDDLSGALADAAYDGDAAATAGSLNYATPDLTWTGSLSPGGSATITYSVTVNNPDTDGKLVINTVTSSAVGSSCPPGTSSNSCQVTIPVLTPALTITKTASAATAVPGQTITYTVTVADSGQTPYTGASVADDLTAVLDDAAYNGNAAATAGSVSYAAPVLTWTGNLSPGGSTTITYSVTVDNPDTGSHVLTNTVTSTAAGNNCPSGSTDARCTDTVTVASLAITNTASVATTTPGSVVRYTATFSNTGQTPYTGITIATNITDVLDDATPNGDQTATSGTLTLTSTGISWTGSIPVGGVVTVTGTVTVNNPDTGNKVMTSTLATTAPGSNCPSGGTDPACTATVDVQLPGLTIVKTANTSVAEPGSVIGYTITVTDSGQTPYTGAVVTDSLAGMVNDAVYNGDAAATAGSVSYASPNLTWTGSLSPGGSATITYSVTVNNPDTGGKLVINTVTSTAAGSTCLPGTTSSSCQVIIPVLTPALTIVQTATTTSGSNAVAIPGGVVSYTITVTNTGQVPYTGAALSDPLGGVLDDATYNNDAAATVGTVTFASPVLSWTGNLSPGAAALITYTVTVNNPDTGDQSLTGTVTSSTPGNNCPAGGGDARCTVTVTVVGASTLTFTQTSAAGSAVAGGTVNYTITIANSGASTYSGASFTDPLGDVLDDASYNNDAATSSGTVAFASSTLSWSGNVPANGTVTITYTVTVNNPDTGNKILTSTINSPSANSNCPAASPGPRCTATVTLAALTIDASMATPTATPGETVDTTVTFTNAGQTPYFGISVGFSTTNTANQFSNGGNQTVSSGTLSIGTDGAVWTGDVPVGGTVTITGSIVIADPYPAGDQVIGITAETTAPGSNCASGSTDPRCTETTDVVIPGLTIVKTANTSVAEPGSVIGYTVTVTDSVQTSYTGAVVTDDLTGALGDAAYDGDAAATSGSLSYAAPVLTWTGDLSPGDSATITYSVTVDSPDTGGKVIVNTVTSSAAGSSCPPGTTSSSCQVTIEVLTPALTITKTASSATAVPGQTITYTVTVTDSGQTPYTGAAFSDDLTSVLGNAAYNSDAAASAGSVSFAAPVLTWTGGLSPGGSATVTYSVTVDNPDTGGHVLTNTVTSSTAGSNCPSGSTDARCSVTVTVSQLTIDSTALPGTATPGSVVNNTTTITNTGQTPYYGISVNFTTSNTASQFSNGGNEEASSGTLSIGTDGAVWTGDVPVGGTVTITGSIVIADPYPAGGQVIAINDATTAPGSNCPAGSTDPRCALTVDVVIPGLTIVKTANTSLAEPGSVIGYTVTVTDSGQTSYTGAVVTDDLTGVLGDAAYDGDAAATSGSVSYADPVLTWTGDLAPGDSATVTYSVTVNNPDTGGKVIINTVTSSAAGSSCPPGTTSSSCQVTIEVLTPALTITKTASTATAVPGQAVTYTITVTDSGQTPYAGAAFSDDLTSVLGNAAYNSDAAASAGSVSYAAPVLTWTGSLAPGDSATVTYSVTVDNPDTGGHVLTNTVTSSTGGSNCPSGSTDARCTATVDVGELTIVNSASTSTTTPGGVVSYTITATNSGQAALAGATLTVGLAQVLDDATYNGDATATAGTVALAGDGQSLTWTGTLTVGATVTITYSVTVNNPDTGDKTLTDTVQSTAPGSTCPASGAAPPACTAVVTVLIPGLTISKTASSSTTTPGSAVQYTISVANTGQTSYTGATVTDDLTGVLNDAAYNGDAAATVGTVSYVSPVLTWTGNLAPGDTATITYSVTVNNPDTGDKHLVNTVVSAVPGSTCPSGSTDPACTVTVTDLIPALTITKTANVASATPGSAVDYTITVADSGQTNYPGATVTDDLTGVLSAAAFNHDAAATTGTVSYASPALTWTGSLAPGDTATITYSVTINNPETGGTSLTNTVTSAAVGSSCPSGTSGGQCTVTTGVISGPLSITAPASADLGSGPPGSTIQASLGTVQVTDGRGFGADWTTSVSSSDFTAGGPDETIPVSDASYAINGLTTATGPATFGYVPDVGLSQNPQGVVNATNVQGNTTVTWNPVIQVAVPGGAIGGTYSATIVHSVS